MTTEEFQALLLREDVETVVENVMLAGEAVHFSNYKKQIVVAELAAKFNVTADEVDVWIVGSAKLGFSITEKIAPGVHLPRFRPFRPDSDIDIAVVCPKIFDIIWSELSKHAYKTPSLPWDSGRLGDYLVHGWLRPDKFPRNARLRRCDDWWDLIRALSVDSRFGRRPLRGGLYHSIDHLKKYQIRGVQQCRIALETP